METQVIELGKLEARWFDPRLGRAEDLEPMRHSNALIINIDYPLGMASYELLSRIAEGAGRLGRCLCDGQGSHSKWANRRYDDSQTSSTTSTRKHLPFPQLFHRPSRTVVYEPRQCP